MASVKVFVKDGCSRCPAAKDMAGMLMREGFDVREYRLDDAEGMAEGAFYGVMSTPTLLVVDADENPLTFWRGVVPETEDIRRALSA
jgi:hypothetical protein